MYQEGLLQYETVCNAKAPISRMLTFGCLGLGTSDSVGAAGLFCRKPQLQKHGCCYQPPEILHIPELLRQSVIVFCLGLLKSYTMIGASAASILSCKSLYLPANTWSGHKAGVEPLDHGL